MCFAPITTLTDLLLPTSEMDDHEVSLVFVESLFFETLMSFTATREQLCLRIILLAKALCIQEQKQEEQIKCCTQTSIKQFTCTTPLFKKTPTRIKCRQRSSYIHFKLTPGIICSLYVHKDANCFSKRNSVGNKSFPAHVI